MLGLLRYALRPKLALKACVEHWGDISFMLREPPRQRELQVEKLIEKRSSLS